VEVASLAAPEEHHWGSPEACCSSSSSAVTTGHVGLGEAGMPPSVVAAMAERREEVRQATMPPPAPFALLVATPWVRRAMVAKTRSS
jgi:hypothetical protein